MEHDTHGHVWLIQSLSVLTKYVIRKILVEQHGQNHTRICRDEHENYGRTSVLIYEGDTKS